MPIISSTDGELLDNAVAQERIRETIRRTGRFYMSAAIPPTIGSVQEFAGLPLKVTRFITYAEALVDEQLCGDLWGEAVLQPEEFYFVVEVAD